MLRRFLFFCEIAKSHKQQSQQLIRLNLHVHALKGGKCLTAWRSDISQLLSRACFLLLADVDNCWQPLLRQSHEPSMMGPKSGHRAKTLKSCAARFCSVGSTAKTHFAGVIEGSALNGKRIISSVDFQFYCFINSTKNVVVCPHFSFTAKQDRSLPSASTLPGAIQLDATQWTLPSRVEWNDSVRGRTLTSVECDCDSVAKCANA